MKRFLGNQTQYGCVWFPGKPEPEAAMLQDMDDKKEKPKRKAPGQTPLDATVQAEIDANLRRVYDAALQEEVPDRFRLLLQQLRDKEGRS
jgi:Anti-sigma factor NepR